MEELFKEACEAIALAIEAVAVLLVAFGALQAVVTIVRVPLTHGARKHPRQQAWLNFGRWLMLGLEFQLAADVIRTAISPTWDEIGQLAAIAVIRTLLDHFLQEDLRRANEATPALQPTSNNTPQRAA
jgi:uncharacterized membrane protein